MAGIPRMKTSRPLRNDPRVLTQPALKREYNRALFAVVAPRYVVATRALSFFRDRSWKRFLISKAATAAPGLILDIATGPGDLAALAIAKWPSATVVGADISIDMMGVSKRRPGTGTIRMACMDMATLAIRASSVDLVTAGYGLRNAPDLPATLAAIKRVLKPGGRVAFLDFSRSPNRTVFFFQYWVLRLWGALWGIMLHGNPAIYAYIAESLALFPDRNELREKMRNVGLTDIVFHRRMLGMIDVIVAVGG